MERSGNNQPQSQPDTDPYMYAAALNSFMVERNPIQVLVGDVAHMLNVVMNLGKTRKMAQQRIDQIQAQVRKVEHDIAYVNPKMVGNRLDKLR